MNNKDLAKSRLASGKRAAPGSYVPLINTADEVDQLLDGYLELQDETVPTNVIPNALTAQSFQDHVRRVHDAVKSTATAEDAFQRNTGGGQAAGRQPTSAMKFINGLNTFEIQLVAGLLVKTVYSMQAGRLGIPAWQCLSALKYEKFDTVEQRMAAVLTSLQGSKALCKNIFFSHLTWEKRVSMQPAAEAKTKGSNSILNAKRDGLLSFAKRNMPENDDEPSSGDTRPTKKACVSKSITIKPLGTANRAAKRKSRLANSSTSVDPAQSPQPSAPAEQYNVPLASTVGAMLGSNPTVAQVRGHGHQMVGPYMGQQSESFDFNFQQQQNVAPGQYANQQVQMPSSQQPDKLSSPLPRPRSQPFAQDDPQPWSNLHHENNLLHDNDFRIDNSNFGNNLQSDNSHPGGSFQTDNNFHIQSHTWNQGILCPQAPQIPTGQALPHHGVANIQGPNNNFGLQSCFAAYFGSNEKPDEEAGPHGP
ncbi:hypothetical protein diail_4897 [Diaporthe ilicicola]|nr:hypothetical protein diail_4897 [Diaporthe ilicicola]